MENKPYLKSVPFDMERFNALTEGKSSAKGEVKDFFFHHISECMRALEKNCHDGHSERWENASNELKKISEEFGAVELSSLSAIAADLSTLGASEKREVLERMKSAIQKLRAFLRNI